MPFFYYGGKKSLAPHYPAPAYGTIIEPFAGSAGYALHWATPRHRVILIEKDPAVVALWQRLQAPDAADDILSITCPPVGFSGKLDPLLLLCQGGIGGQKAFTEGEFTVTGWMVRNWRNHCNRILSALPIIKPWTIIEGDYTEAPNLRATWFIDPPYWVPEHQRGRRRGDGYAMSASEIDFDALGAWCQTRRGQTIVCEQDGATWLPFRPLRHAHTASSDEDVGTRLEVVWTRTPGRVLATPRASAQTKQAKARRSARRAR